MEAYLMTKGHIKRSYSFPPELFEDIDYLSRLLGVSRSAFLTALLTEPCADLRRLLSDVEAGTPSELLRFRGESMELIRERVEKLKGMDDDLFSNKVR